MAYNDPQVLAALRREHHSADLQDGESLVDYPADKDDLHHLEDEPSVEPTRRTSP